ncbi:MAG: menaquinol oxidoreductase [Candidatus Rokubacteria bacterium RIFCSPLOWO2_02_FULL_68_19]|nr:MAG: menaquinol oxidoreductase [Candidatus Rokubacteria bacterium RIFCSPLOWO2_02_FULL_68_19]OGL11188.1 MAG: menaquinol oxidoreductase [Candidatus Rokubacteria bacterium RIFCSPHIGHO2_02_FULL_69_13]
MVALEKALVGNRRYWTWIGALLVVIALGVLSYLRQLQFGLGITGLSRDVTWGLYIAQFTFLVGVAASAVVVVLPYYLHNYRAFGKITILGEFLAISAVTMCLLFIFVDMGQPGRVLNVLLYPTPDSIMFWDMVVLSGYLLLNAVIGGITLGAERKDVPPPRWILPVIILSIPWAVSIHTVTAFLYSGLPGRHLWLTALLAPRFLASAFASGPALLILLTMVVRRLARFDPGQEAIQKLSLIVTYTMIINVFFVLMEVFTVFYSQIPEPMSHFQFLFVGLDGHAPLVPWMWASMALAVISLVLLITPRYRANERLLAVACVMVFASLWIDKGMGLIVGGFVPSPLGHVTSYVPTLPEVSITLAIWAVGFLMLTVLYKMALAVREELA